MTSTKTLNHLNSTQNVKNTEEKDSNELRRNQESQLRRNWDTWAEKFLEVDESGNDWSHDIDLCPLPRSKKKYHWCKMIPVAKGDWYDLWASCDPRNEVSDGGSNKDRINHNKFMWPAYTDAERLEKLSLEDEEEPLICHTPNLPVLQRNGIPGG